MKPTIFNALLRRNKTEKIREDSIFLEYSFNGLFISVFSTKEDNFLISELDHSEEIKLTKSQKDDLQTLVYQKRLLESINMEDYHPKRPI